MLTQLDKDGRGRCRKRLNDNERIPATLADSSPTPRRRRCRRRVFYMYFPRVTALLSTFSSICRCPVHWRSLSRLLFLETAGDMLTLKFGPFRYMTFHRL